MKRYVWLALAIALLVPGVAFADEPPPPLDCVNGGCADNNFVWACAGWTQVAVQAVADALGINVTISGTVGPLPYTATTELARFQASIDGGYRCTGNCGYGVVSTTGTEVLNVTNTAGPYNLAFHVPTDTSVPHTVEVLVSQDGCVNCPRIGNVEVAPYIPPPPPEKKEECKDHKLYQMATFEFPSGRTGTLVSWDGYPANIDRQMCHFGEVAENTPIFEWVTRDSCTGAITYNGETYPYYDPDMEKPHWHGGACANTGGCDG